MPKCSNPRVGSSRNDPNTYSHGACGGHRNHTYQNDLNERIVTRWLSFDRKRSVFVRLGQIEDEFRNGLLPARASPPAPYREAPRRSAKGSPQFRPRLACSSAPERNHRRSRRRRPLVCSAPTLRDRRARPARIPRRCAPRAVAGRRRRASAGRTRTSRRYIASINRSSASSGGLGAGQKADAEQAVLRVQQSRDRVGAPAQRVFATRAGCCDAVHHAGCASGKSLESGRRRERERLRRESCGAFAARLLSRDAARARCRPRYGPTKLAGGGSHPATAATASRAASALAIPAPRTRMRRDGGD